ncbi:MAG: transposase [Thermomicrobiales bacterium]
MLLILAGPPAQRAHRWAWSRFRRRHQAVAKRCHTARRARSSHPIADPPVQTLATALPDLTAARWTRIAGILWVIQRGAAWNELPPEFGPWHTVNRRYRRWRQDGTWGRMPAILRSPDA